MSCARVQVEGLMRVQFYIKDAATGALSKDGEPLTLAKGDAGYIAANRVHDATYVEKCKLVYVHSGAFGFTGH